MFYALIVICLVGVSECDIDHAIYAEQSPPLFSSIEECVEAARAHVIAKYHDIPALRGADRFVLDISCETVGAPA